GPSCLSHCPGTLAAGVRQHGAAAGTRLAGIALLLRLPLPPVAQATHHQPDRALLRGSAPPHPAHGLLCKRRKCGPHHLLHLPEIQPGMENPHPLRIYTGALTSPGPPKVCLFALSGVYLCMETVV